MFNKKMDTPLFQLTVGEFLELQKSIDQNGGVQTVPQSSGKNFVYGLKGIAGIFNCSIQTAFKIKASGVIDEALTQVGRIIVVDSGKAIELAGKKTGGRRK